MDNTDLAASSVKEIAKNFGYIFFNVAVLSLRSKVNSYAKRLYLVRSFMVRIRFNFKYQCTRKKVHYSFYYRLRYFICSEILKINNQVTIIRINDG